MRIGFTGTRDGMTKNQKRLLSGIIERLNNENETVDEFHHGDCIGADEEAHNIMKDYSDNVGFIEVHIHPPNNNSSRAFCQGFTFHEEPKPYLERNRDIVDECDLLIACPKDFNQTRSGTWYTINYAKKKGKPVVILW